MMLDAAPSTLQPHTPKGAYDGDGSTYRMKRWARATIAALFGPLLLASGFSAAGAEPMLEAVPWQDRGYGLSLHPPRGAIMQPWPAGDVRMRFLGRAGFTLDLMIRKKRPVDHEEAGTVPVLIMPFTETPSDRFHFQIRTGHHDVTLPRLETITIKAMEVADPTAVLFDRTELTIDRHTVNVLYFQLTPTQARGAQAAVAGTPWVMAWALMLVEPNTFALLRLQVDQDNFALVRPVFEAVVSSIRLQDARKQAATRAAMIERGKHVQALLDTHTLAKSLIQEQWYRLAVQDLDVGYMRLHQRAATELNMPGLGIEIATHLRRDGQVYESQSQLFLSDDAEHELWSIHTARRDANPQHRRQGKAPGKALVRWSETGVRSGRVIHVKRRGPHGAKDRHWTCPPQGYLSQVTRHLMAPLVPHGQQQTMAFYAYHPNTGRILMRTFTVEPISDGSFHVVTAPSPDHPEDVTYFDRAGQLLRRQFHSGLTIYPSTAARMRQMWNLAE